MKIDLIPLGVQFTFDVQYKNSNERTRFYKLFYGYTDYSNNGNYDYERRGFLSNINYLKPTKSTIIVSMNDAPVLHKFFKKKKVKFSENFVVLHHFQARKLGVESPSKWTNIYRDLLGKQDLIVSVDF